MRYVNNVSKRALEIYVDSEHVDITSKLLIEVVEQIQKNANAEENLSEVDVADHAVAGLMQIIMDVADSTGYHRLYHDLQMLSLEYRLSHIE